MSKGGSKTTEQSIPKYLEDAVKENLNQAKLAAQIGYVPYYGPDVAGLSPMETAARQNTMGAMSAFGMAPAGAQYQSGLPEQVTVNGVTGYRSGDLYDAALRELNVRAPDQAKRYTDFYQNLNNRPMYSSGSDPRLDPSSPMYDPAYYNNVMASGGGDGGPQVGNNYWAQREAEVGKERAFAEQSAQNQKINDAISNFGILGLITGGTPTNTPAPVTNMNSYSPDAVTDTGFGKDPSQGGYWG